MATLNSKQHRACEVVGVAVSSRRHWQLTTHGLQVPGTVITTSTYLGGRLCIAAGKGDSLEVGWFLRHGADVNHKGHEVICS